jgi:hypothetical protein
MSKVLCLLLAFGGVILLQGCYCAPVKPAPGYIFSEYRAPLDIDFDPTMVTSKSGMSESTSILGLIATGDCSAKTAAANGGIGKIHHADYEFYNILGVIQRFRTVVYGE